MSLIDEKPYSPGLEGVFAGESALCQVDEGESGLRYRGYAIEDLANHAGPRSVGFGPGSPVHCVCSQDAVRVLTRSAAVVVDDPVVEPENALSLS